MSLMKIMYFVRTLCFSKAYHMTFRGILLYAFSKSMNIICRFFFCSLYFSISCRTKKISSMVELSGMKSN
uniref:Uncharacterized protein n=1 Tax=Arundo donax TaxID=35708 RepID=A0A0A9FP40_ARUDO